MPIDTTFRLTLEHGPGFRLNMERMRDAELKIGELAIRCGVSRDTIRFYEREGLLPRPGRTPSQYRVYDSRDEDRRDHRGADDHVPLVRRIPAAVRRTGYVSESLVLVRRFRAAARVRCRGGRHGEHHSHDQGDDLKLPRFGGRVDCVACVRLPSIVRSVRGEEKRPSEEHVTERRRPVGACGRPASVAPVFQARWESCGRVRSCCAWKPSMAFPRSVSVNRPPPPRAVVGGGGGRGEEEKEPAPLQRRTRMPQDRRAEARTIRRSTWFRPHAADHAARSFRTAAASCSTGLT